MLHDNGSSDLMTFNGRVLSSIFDDTDPAYHADPLTGQTPAKGRAIEASAALTRALLARVALVKRAIPR